MDNVVKSFILIKCMRNKKTKNTNNMMYVISHWNKYIYVNDCVKVSVGVQSLNIEDEPISVIVCYI